MDPLFKLVRWRLIRLEMRFTPDLLPEPGGTLNIGFDTEVDARFMPDRTSAYIQIDLTPKEGQDGPEVEAGAQAIFEANAPAGTDPDSERRVATQMTHELFGRLNGFIVDTLRLGIGAGLAWDPSEDDDGPLPGLPPGAPPGLIWPGRGAPWPRLSSMTVEEVSFALMPGAGESPDLSGQLDLRVTGEGEARPDGSGADFRYRLAAGGDPPQPCRLEIGARASYDFGTAPDGDPDWWEGAEKAMSRMASMAFYRLVARILELAGIPTTGPSPGPDAPYGVRH